MQDFVSYSMLLFSCCVVAWCVALSVSRLPTGHSHIVGLLLEKNADYSCSDGNGATALHYAVSQL